MIIGDYMLRYFSTNKKEDLFLLSDEDLYHIKTVMRMKTKDEIEIIYDHTLYICELVEDGGSYKGKMKQKVYQDYKELDITLIVPLLKEQKMDLILQKATELGVNKIIPFSAKRSVVKIDQNKESHKLLRWNRICKEASEQAKRLSIPIVTTIHTLEQLQNLQGLSILCSTREKKRTIRNLLQSNKNYDKMNIIMGPEGGFTIEEETFLEQNKFHSITLGKRIMRVETVPLFLMSVINYEYMEW